MIRVISIIIYLILTVGGLILVKSGADTTKIAIENGAFNFSMQLKVMLGFLSYVGSFLIYTFYIIKKFDLSYIYPIIAGITQILIIAAGVILFKEKISPLGIGGIILIIIGVVLLNIK